jgi:hypothetical protein
MAAAAAVQPANRWTRGRVDRLQQLVHSVRDRANKYLVEDRGLAPNFSPAEQGSWFWHQLLDMEELEQFGLDHLQHIWDHGVARPAPARVTAYRVISRIPWQDRRSTWCQEEGVQIGAAFLDRPVTATVPNPDGDPPAQLAPVEVQNFVQSCQGLMAWPAAIVSLLGYDPGWKPWGYDDEDDGDEEEDA